MPVVRQTGLFLREQAAAHLGTFTRFHEHTLMSALTSAPRWPTAPLLIIINLTRHENTTGRSRITGCCVYEGIHASLLPKTCQRLPTVLGMKSKLLSRMACPDRTLRAHTFPLTAHTHTPTGRPASTRRFSKTSCPLLPPALAQAVPSARPLFTCLLAWLMPAAPSEPSGGTSSSRELPEPHCWAPIAPTQTPTGIHPSTPALRFLVFPPHRPELLFLHLRL